MLELREWCPKYDTLTCWVLWTKEAASESRSLWPFATLLSILFLSQSMRRDFLWSFLYLREVPPEGGPLSWTPSLKSTLTREIELVLQERRQKVSIQVTMPRLFTYSSEGSYLRVCLHYKPAFVCSAVPPPILPWLVTIALQEPPSPISFCISKWYLSFNSLAHFWV